MAAAVFGGTLTLAQTETQPSAVASRQQHYAVMALAWGYPPSAYAAFLGSLRRTGYSGAILLFEPLPTGSSTMGGAHKGGLAATAFQSEYMRDGYVLNADRSLAPVLHQCERSPSRSQLRPPMDASPSPRASASRSDH